MWKLFILVLGLELCMLVNFSTSLSNENNDMVPERQIRSVVNTKNSTTKPGGFLNKIMKKVSDNLPKVAQKVNSTLKHIGVDKPSGILKTLSQPNVTLKDIQSTIKQTAIKIGMKKTQELADNLATLLAQHKAKSALNDIKKVTANDPTVYLMRLKAPWKHVSEKHSNNETEVVQLCKFEKLTVSCLAEYVSWNAKVWFLFNEAPGKNGINITIFTTGYLPKASFNQLANGVHCKAVKDSRVHHICVKAYGYGKQVGSSRFCLQIGAAISNHGIASSDFGCFRFASSITHENPKGNEILHPNTLMSHMLNLNVNTYRKNAGSFLLQANSVMPVLIVVTTLLYLSY